MTRRFITLTVLLAGLTGFLIAAQEPSDVKIMTQNMDAGTDLSFVVFGLLTNQPQLGIDLTLAELLVSKFQQRADLLAGRIAAEKPHLVALQEATLWRTGLTPETATNVLADQIQLLLDALAQQGTPYELIAANRVADTALPGTAGALRITDRDAVLMRADLRPPVFHISEVHTHIYHAVFKIADLQVPAGWISLTIHTGNKHFRFATTHLQSPVPGFPNNSVAVQQAQAAELLQEFRNSAVPVVLAGDFNSDGILGAGGPGPDNTPTAANIVAAGYTDVWHAANPADPGATWPLYLEDQLPPPNFYAPFAPYERIDQIFSRGIEIVGAVRIFAPAASGLPSFGSDHAGVIATFHP